MVLSYHCVRQGVMISHRSVIAAIKCMNTIMSDVDFEPRDPFVAYLPLAHCMEFICEHLVMAIGVPIGYSSPTTLTQMSPAVKAGSAGDADVLKPNALLGVPLILDRIRKGITEKVEGRGKRTKKLFQFALDYKNYWSQKGYNTPLLNQLMCAKVNKSLGGNLDYMFCGGGTTTSLSKSLDVLGTALFTFFHLYYLSVQRHCRRKRSSSRRRA